MRLCAECKDPDRPLTEEHGNRRFHADCHAAYRKRRNAQYKQAQKLRRADGAYVGELVVVPPVLLLGAVVTELSAIAGRLRDRAELLTGALAGLDVDEEVLDLAADVRDLAGDVQAWATDRLPAPIRRRTPPST